MSAAFPAADTRWQDLGEGGRLWTTEGNKTVYLGGVSPETVIIVGDDAGAVEEAARTLHEELSK